MPRKNHQNPLKTAAAPAATMATNANGRGGERHAVGLRVEVAAPLTLLLHLVLPGLEALGEGGAVRLGDLLELAEDELVALGHLVEEELAELLLVGRSSSSRRSSCSVSLYVVVSLEPKRPSSCTTTRSRSMTLRFTRSSSVAVTSSLPTLPMSPDEGGERRRQLRLWEVAQVLRLELRLRLAPEAEVQEQR